MSATKTRTPRHRKSCNSCFIAKVRCSKDRPMCSRCLSNGLACGWSQVSLPGTESTDSTPTSSSKREVTPNKDPETSLSPSFSRSPPNPVTSWIPANTFPTELPKHSQYKAFHMNGAQPIGLQANGNPYTSIVPPLSGDRNGMMGSPTQLVAPHDVYTPMSFSSSQEFALNAFSQSVGGTNTPMISPVMRPLPLHLQTMPNSPWENHQHQDLMPQFPVTTSNNMDFHSPTLGGAISLSPMFPQLDPPSLHGVSNGSSQGIVYDISNSVSNIVSNGMPNGISPDNTPGSSHSSICYGSCNCYYTCLQTLGDLHIISDSSSYRTYEKFNEICEINIKAIDACAAALDCPGCMAKRQARTQKDTLVWGLILADVSSFYNQVLGANPDGSGTSTIPQGASFPQADEKWTESGILAIYFRKLEGVLTKFRDASLLDGSRGCMHFSIQIEQDLAKARQTLNSRKHEAPYQTAYM